MNYLTVPYIAWHLLEFIFLVFVSDFSNKYKHIIPALLYSSVWAISFFLIPFRFSSIILPFIASTVLSWFGNNSFGPSKLESLKGKITIVTGVAENGIGYYIAKGLLELDATVIIAVRC